MYNDIEYSYSNKRQRCGKKIKEEPTEEKEYSKYELDNYNDVSKVYSKKQRYNKVMSLIHLIVIFHVIMYIWNMTEAADGNDPMQGVKDLKADIDEERLKKRREREREYGAQLVEPATGGRKSTQRGGVKPPQESTVGAAKQSASGSGVLKPGEQLRKEKEALAKADPGARGLYDKVKNKASDTTSGSGADASASGGPNNSAQPSKPRNYGLPEKMRSNPFTEAMESSSILTQKVMPFSKPVLKPLIDLGPPVHTAGTSRILHCLTVLLWGIRAFVLLLGTGLYILTYGTMYTVLMVVFIVLFAYDAIPNGYTKIKEFIKYIGDTYKKNTNALALFIQLLPAIAVFYTIGLWFAPTFGLGICIAYAIFVQLKMVAFILFGAKNANLTKAHLRKCRYGLTFMTLLMIGYAANQNLKFNTSIGVTLAITACMFIMLCR